jgi:arabinan endo-1,5-alpha-L-arabinosidase
MNSISPLSGSLQLHSPDGAPSFSVILELGTPLRLSIAAQGGPARRYEMQGRRHEDYHQLFAALARDVGLRPPQARRTPPPKGSHPHLRPVLTEPISPLILYGYGDPCVVRVATADYRLLVTSNDAPDIFPILSSSDLETWRLSGFVFARGAAPAWALTGPEVSDFWAPELHKVGDEWWVCFSARAADRTLCVGIARSSSPDGPYRPDNAPLVRGGVIDPHIIIDDEDQAWLVWKKDDNDVWPSALAALLRDQPGLIPDLFTSEEDRRTAAFVLTLWPWVETLEPMEQFFAQQPLIEAAAGDLPGFVARLAFLRPGLAPPEAARVDKVMDALRTRIFAQQLSADGTGLTGEPSVILQNDLPWEGHLIEGVWITRQAGRYYLLYAGNDFSTPLYGIGVAVAYSPTGPYRKSDEVFLSSTREWWGPGHPSVVASPDGGLRMFLHAFQPGHAGYKAFRALLTTPIVLSEGAIGLDD